MDNRGWGCSTISIQVRDYVKYCRDSEPEQHMLRKSVRNESRETDNSIDNESRTQDELLQISLLAKKQLLSKLDVAV